jgi:hypothetical protein
MMQDFSWVPSAKEYLKLYRHMIGLPSSEEETQDAFSKSN